MSIPPEHHEGSDAAAADPTPVSYGVGPLRRLPVHLVLAVPGLALTAAVYRMTAHPAAWPVLAALALWLLGHVAISRLLGTVGLDLSPAGVRSRNFGTAIEVAWSGVEAAVFSDAGHGLALKAPATGRTARLTGTMSGLRRGGVPFLGETERARLAEGRWLSLTIYARAIRRGDLAARIDGFAPHLRAVEARAAWLELARRPKPGRAAGLWKTAGVIVGTVSAVVGLRSWNQDAAYATLFVLVSLGFVYSAAHALCVAAASLKRRDYTRAAVSLACGIPGYMFLYFVIGGIAGGVRHADHRPPTVHPAVPAGQPAPAADRPASGGPPPRP